MKNKKGIRIAFTVLAVAAICGFIGLSIKLYLHKKEVERTVNSRQWQEADGNSGIIEYNGKKYRRNTAIRAILCIGVDSSGQMTEKNIIGAAGQADGVFLVAQDMARDTVKILMIPRDTMTEITLYDLSGNSLGKDKQHLTLAFAYGDGREKSCELMREAVSELLGGLKIDGYLAMNTSAISVLNDAIGGVEVTIEEEGLEKRDPELKYGETLILKGRQAETFVRYRDINKPQTAIQRMDRQEVYMKAFLKKAKDEFSKDNSLAGRLMKEIQDYMITDMAKDEYMDMGLAVLNSRQNPGDDDFIMLQGEGVETELFDEYHPDTDKVMQTVLELFYKETR